MWKPSKTIDVNAQSSVDLKTELLKKREEFEREKQALAGSSSKKGRALEFKRMDANKGIEERNDKDRFKAQGLSREEILKRKAALYQRLERGEYQNQRDRDLVYNEDVLVDFERKNVKEESEDEDDEMVEITDRYGRTRLVPRSKIKRRPGNILENTEDDYKDYDVEDTRGFHMFPPVEQIRTNPEVYREKRRREEEAKQDWASNINKFTRKMNEHFDSKREIRELGVGFYQFSDDIEERRNQQEELRAIRHDTQDKQAAFAREKELRRQRIKERTEQLKETKLKQDVSDCADEAAAFLEDLFPQ